METALRRAGVRITRPRRIILAILADHDDHPDAQAIFRRAVRKDASISLSTVYRDTGIDLDDLPSFTRSTVERTISADSLEAADVIVDRLRDTAEAYG